MAFVTKDYPSNLSIDATAELMKKFETLDADCTGFISYVELAEAFSGPGVFPLVAAKLLSRVYSQQCEINQEEFFALHGFVENVESAFESYNAGGQMTPEDVKLALFELNFNFTKEAVFTLCNNFGRGRVSYSQFVEISSFALLGRRLFSEWDNQLKGEITVGLEQVLRLALWFM